MYFLKILRYIWKNIFCDSISGHLIVFINDEWWCVCFLILYIGIYRFDWHETWHIWKYCLSSNSIMKEFKQNIKNYGYYGYYANLYVISSILRILPSGLCSVSQSHILYLRKEIRVLIHKPLTHQLVCFLMKIIYRSSSTLLGEFKNQRYHFKTGFMNVITNLII